MCVCVCKISPLCWYSLDLQSVESIPLCDRYRSPDALCSILYKDICLGSFSSFHVMDQELRTSFSHGVFSLLYENASFLIG